MEKYFANYDQSIAMKELGFDEPCMGVYYGDVEDIQFTLNVRETQYYAQKGYKNGVLAPLKTQVFEWFRETHGLWFRPDYYDESKEYDFQGSIHKLGRYNSLVTLDNHKTVNDLESSCIDKLIEIVKDGKFN